MSLPAIGPEHAGRLVEEGAILIDVREADEHARERIPGARLMPLSRLDAADLGPAGAPVVFHCRSGARTHTHGPRLAAKAGPCAAYVLEGGLEAWKKAGLPVVVDRKQPLEIQRQVQLGAGALAFFGTLLGLLVSPWFLAVPLFVGAGLITAGATGFCGLARILVRMPWNRTAAPAGAPKAA
ncbi:MAG TPA: rhodanese family protein [Beijerinckiaceae bacterium]|nr:rhodanese family protein [Beijerinckiaceae bacterium]